ncbi:hypothetical protein ACFSJU_10835 [Paradesertivirga mongoliensis]|uniref:Uncharacterized protein n=1 Tax=Paradesertivirga mongoliensis TaxID=2100740 RepID=A0ABW4ZLB9_9SPHI|nr:hypothetical protein [Pedobacter mongoliensis]
MKYYPALILFVFLASCGNENKETSKQYFDIKGYFSKEVKKLQKQNPVISKTVLQNGQSEARSIMLDNWEAELELFSASDINKPAWKNSYQVINTGNIKEYISKDKQLKTRKISIESYRGTIKHITILNASQNMLYSSEEQLDYYPDSLYSIKKRQTVRIMGTNSYSIFARFKN